MSEPIKVLVVLWSSDGEPNCDLYRNIYAFKQAYPNDEFTAREASANPGAAFAMNSSPGLMVRCCEVAPVN